MKCGGYILGMFRKAKRYTESCIYVITFNSYNSISDIGSPFQILQRG